ncbi:MAG: IPT/TIG domain-containing protein [Steroidobacteraceae bacterium]
MGRIFGISLSGALARLPIFSVLSLYFLLCGVTLWTFSAQAASTQYFYDNLGRVTQATDENGSTVQYQYDPNGNIEAINRLNSSDLSISSVFPLIVHAGNVVTVTGTGFSATPGQNDVTIAGVPVVVSASNATTLSFAVPLGAIGGPISVTTSGVTVTSSDHLVVQYPSISGLSPTIVNPSALVTLTGQYLNFDPASTGISVGGVSASISALSSSSLVFAAPSLIGASSVVVNTSYGSATSATLLAVIPSIINASTVASYGQITSGAAAQPISISAASKYAVLEFNATAGQWYSLRFGSLVMVPSGGSVSYTIYSPTNAVFASGTLSATNTTVHLPMIATAGKYLVSLGSGTKTSVQVQTQLLLNPVVAIDGSSVSASTTVAGLSLRFAFSGTAGQNVGVAVSNLSGSTGNYATAYVLKPDGTTLYSGTCYIANGGCQFVMRNLPSTGTYLVRVDPYNSNSTMSFNLTLSVPVTGALSVGGSQLVSLVPGQYTLLTFNATAGQTVAVNVGSVVTTPAGKTMQLNVYGPTGSTVVATTFTASSYTSNLYNLAGGAYTVLIAPNNPNITSVNAQVNLVAGVTGTLAADNSSISVASSVAGQSAYYTFYGTAGQNLGLAVSNLSSSAGNLVSAYVLKPDGSTLYSDVCYIANGGCQFVMRNLPSTGTYLVRVDPYSSSSSTSFNLTLSVPVTGALSVGGSQSVSLVPGQYTLLTFNATAGQAATVGVNSMATVPSGKYMYLYVYNPSGTLVSSTSFTSAKKTLSLSNLVAGSYVVSLVPMYPNITSAAMQVTLQ